MKDILSSAGVTLRDDDSPPSSYGGAAAKAGNKIDFYLYKFYTPENLVLSDLVKDWAATIACYYLCSRRGNPCPQGIAALYQEAIEDIKTVLPGVSEIPGIAARHGYAPALTVMRATLRPYPRTVVERSTSTHASGEAANYHQHKDAWDAFGFNNSSYLDLVV